MYLACLRPYNQMNDEEGLPVTLSLSDEGVELILEALDNATGPSITITLKGQAHDVVAQTIPTVLVWDARLAAFVVSIGERAAGIIPLDELSGSLGMMLDDQAEPCVVCLSGQLDVYRRGVLNLETGTIQVFTKTPGFGYLGAHAFLTARVDQRWDGFRIAVDKGDASQGPLRVPSHQLYRLKQRNSGFSKVGKQSAATIADLTSMTRRYAAFNKDTKSRQ